MEIFAPWLKPRSPIHSPLPLSISSFFIADFTQQCHDLALNYPVEIVAIAQKRTIILITGTKSGPSSDTNGAPTEQNRNVDLIKLGTEFGKFVRKLVIPRPFSFH